MEAVGAAGQECRHPPEWQDRAYSSLLLEVGEEVVVDSKGVAHTISVPDPTIVIGRRALTIIRDLKRASRADLENQLEKMEDEVLR